MDTAVENYARYRRSDDAWMLGAFVVPVARCDEFLGAARRHQRGDDDAWRLSAVVGEDVASEMARVGELGADGARVDAVEVKLRDLAGAGAPSDVIPAGLRAFVEIPAGGEVEADLKDLTRKRARTRRLCAKIRTGGVTPELIPTVGDVARFVRLCYANNVAFKATAGLHHAVRGEHALTYDAEAPRAVMHGFLNVFLAAAFCFNGLGAADAPRMLSLESVEEWRFDDRGARWEDYQVSTREIEAIRRRFAVSFGSCSFEEPLDDLRHLGLVD
jgi:hypothetical protein